MTDKIEFFEAPPAWMRERSNCRAVYLPEAGVVELCASDKAIFAGRAREPPEGGGQGVKRSQRSQRSEAGVDLRRSAGRAAQRLRWYALTNRLPVFATFTLAPDKIDRYDAQAVTRRLGQWLDNRVRRKGLRYLIVPERHRDGAIHYHGLMNDVLPMVESGTWLVPGCKRPRKPRTQRQAAEWREAGHQIVYNLPDWSLGFSTAMYVRGDYHQAVNYVAKYVTKQQEDGGGKVAGRWYYHSGNLDLPEQRVGSVDVRSLMERGARVRNLPEAGFSLVFLTVKMDDLLLR